MNNCVINNLSFTGNCLEHVHSWSACQKNNLCCSQEKFSRWQIDDIFLFLSFFFFFFFFFFFPYNNFCHANFLKFECSVKILQPEDIRKNISEGGLLIICTQHAKGLATGAEKNQYQLLPRMFSNMIKGTGLPAWSVFIAAVDFFHNKKI